MRKTVLHLWLKDATSAPVLRTNTLKTKWYFTKPILVFLIFKKLRAKEGISLGKEKGYLWISLGSIFKEFDYETEDYFHQ